MRPFICLLACVVCACAPSAHGAGVYVTGGMLVGPKAGNMPGHRVYRVDLDRKTVDCIYDRGEMDVSLVVVSPNGKFLAVACSASSFGYLCVDIIDPEGNRLAVIENAGESVAWSPDGSSLSYTTSYQQPGKSSRVSTGTWVRVIGSEKPTKVWDKGDGVYWASFDGKLYIRDGRQAKPVSVYDPATRSILETDLRDILLSPDGKYYWWLDEADMTAKLVERKSGKDRTPRDGAFAGGNLLSSPRWLSPRLVQTCDGFIFCIESCSLLEAPGKILSLADDEKSVYVSAFFTGEIRKVALSELEVRYKGNSSEQRREALPLKVGS